MVQTVNWYKLITGFDFYERLTYDLIFFSILTTGESIFTAGAVGILRNISIIFIKINAVFFICPDCSGRAKTALARPVRACSLHCPVPDRIPIQEYRMLN